MISTNQLHQRKRSNSSLSDDWWTPKVLFRELCDKYELMPELDVSASKKNHLCDVYYTEKDNALEKSWYYQYHDYIGGVDVWCNPPNSLLGKFVLKAWEEYKKHNMRIMMITPTNVMSSRAFWEGVEDPRRVGEQIFYEPIRGRIKFLENGKPPKFSARNAYMVILWGVKAPKYKRK